MSETDKGYKQLGAKYRVQPGTVLVSIGFNSAKTFKWHFTWGNVHGIYDSIKKALRSTKRRIASINLAT